MKKRLDQILQEQGLARTRSHAQRIIKDGFVQISGQIVTDPAQGYDFQDIQSKIVIQDEARFVSRGSLKLIGALDRLKLSVADKNCLDIGISTGGFTQVLLERGARHVVGVDVGTNQLAPELRNHPNLEVFEGLNARDLNSYKLGNRVFDLIVVDVSFISLRLLIENLAKLLTPNGQLICLVKPQFELGQDALNKRGVVKDEALYQELEANMRKSIEKAGLRVKDYFLSSIKGGDGNTEFFCYALKPE